MASPITAHPNATTALVSGAGAGSIIVWLLGRYGVSLGAEVANVIGGGLAAFALLVGRKGLKGIIRSIWRGNEGE